MIAGSRGLKVAVAACITLMSLWATYAKADQSVAIQWLSAQQVNLFQFGLVRLNDKCTSFAFGLRNNQKLWPRLNRINHTISGECNVFIRSESDKITLSIGFVADTPKSIDEEKAICSELWDMTIENILPSYSNPRYEGNGYYSRTSELMEDVFDDYLLKREDVPSFVHKVLAANLELNVTLLRVKDKNVNIITSCRSKVAEKNIKYSEFH